MPVISNAGRAGGVVLFLDDTEVAPWLLVPLPPGVRCVMAPRTDTPAPRGFACLRLEGLKGPAAEELQERLGCRVDGPVNPLELHLAAQLSRRNLDQCDLKELIAATVSTLKDAVGESVREALCAIACSRVGLHDEDGPREQEGFGQLRCVDGSFLQSYDDFERLRERSDEPLLIRQAAFTFEASRFSLDHLAEELKDLTLPQKSLSAKQGGNTSQCTLLVADQGGDAVMSAKPHLWNPQGCSFRTLAEKIRHGLYLTTRSGKARVRRVDEELFYDKVEDPDGKDVLVEAFVARVPVPLLLPKDLGCQVAFWMGTTGNNFGLHSDLFTEQFLCQHQGVKEVLLLLPEDAAIVQPFPFLESPLFYKSRARTVDNLTLSNAKCFRVVLEPGDVLFIPLFWWHEVRTLQGPAVSTTYRFHTEDAERFLKVMNAFYQFHKNALECAVFSEVPSSLMLWWSDQVPEVFLEPGAPSVPWVSSASCWALVWHVVRGERAPGGLHAWSVIVNGLAPLLVREDTGCFKLKPLLLQAVEPSSGRALWHQRLANFFHALPEPKRRVEACYHFWRLNDTSSLLRCITEWTMFETLERAHRPALLDYCRAIGGYATMRRALSKADTASLHQRIVIGRFFSHVGEFAAAKEALLQAKPEAAASENPADLGQVCTLIAENEIRYWDSLRNWGSPGALKDLMECSRTAVDIFRRELERCDRMSTRVEYAQALSRWANGCFKISCVINMVMAYSFLSKADEAIQEVEDLFKGCPPSKVLGRAVLVRGVSKLVLGHNRQRYRLPHRDILVEAAHLLMRAEEILVHAAGEVNEGSIYTHGNLSELYLHDVGHVPERDSVGQNESVIF
ncbi:unnamed protein product [Durusdinium trenchii]|uniref:JmjC domain-containing protein n=1 Tax=Durusdinium trenchii TaxID=1381693 RepID=A0ABP0H979_9DINO